MEIIFHIGYNKTGTSSIQSFFAGQRSEALEAGLLYPETGCFNNAHYGFSDFFVKQPSVLSDELRKNLMSNLVNEVKKTNPRKILLSSEYFTLAGPVATAKIKESFDECFKQPKYLVVVYLRRHDLWFESLFNQAVKTVDQPQWGLNIEDFVLCSLGLPATSYLTQLRKWAKVFGKKNLIVRPFETAQFNQGDLLIDFISRITPGMSIPANLSPYKENTSISLNQLYQIGLLRRMQPGIDVELEIARILSMPAGVGEKPCPVGFGKLTITQRRSLVNLFGQEYTLIAKNFLARKSGKLFHERVA
jgi:hypothetical protein